VSFIIRRKDRIGLFIFMNELKKIKIHTQQSTAA
jgi:hypothetical protein